MSSMMRRSRELLEVARNFRESNTVTDVALRQFLASLDTPKALAVWLLYKNEEHDQLVDLGVDPNHYISGHRFKLDYAAISILSKASFLKTTFDRKEVAMKKFFEFEELCAQTNRRFRNPSLDPQNHGSNVWLLNATRRKISQVLGDYSGDEFVDEANWGPGVSTLVKGEEVSAYNKFLKERGITRDLYALVGPWFATAYPRWHQHLSRPDPETGTESDEGWCSFEAGNDIVTVPKNSKTDRVIAIEPGFNTWFQKAVGSMIRRRLRRFGIDLNSQEVNQRLSRFGSENPGSLASVDFSSASDSISLELVRELLPPRWFQLMDACRSKVGRKGTSIVRWEKFSSMGNGFTFELESLIFYAAASACVEYSTMQGVPEAKSFATDFWINVFGDDVIIPVHAFPLFSSFSAFLGFRVNPKKSFSSGPFRESCGAHWFDGVNCKPIFLKERVRYVEDCFKLANSIRLLAHRYNNHRSCDSRFLDCWRYLHDRVPEPLRLKVPVTAGDTGFVSNFDEATPARARYGIEGFHYRALTSTGVTRSADGDALILARLWVQSTQAHGNNYALRGRTRRSLATSLVPRWYNLGPWS